MITFKRRSWFIRFCYGWGLLDTPSHTSICKLFWLMIVSAICHAIVLPLVGVACAVWGVMFVIERLTDWLNARVPLGALCGKVADGIDKVTSITPLRVTSEWLRAKKSRVCPIVHLADEDDAA